MRHENIGIELPLELRTPLLVERPEGSGVLVRLNDSYLRSIAYIGCAHPGSDSSIDSHGTAFLVVHEQHTYLVTAAHVAVDFQDAPVDVRLNRNDNGLGRIEHIDEPKWYFHPDDTVDVAVMPFVAPAWARVEYLKSKYFATDFKVGTKNFGAGDLAYVVGIFNKMRGRNKNVPFVHTGNIASMGGGETVLVRDWRLGAAGDATLETYGYLIQVTTLPESSGSPVFVRRSLQLAGVRHEDASGQLHSARTWGYGSVWLLGLWHGSWETEERGITVGADTGLCVPVPKILEALNRQDLVEMRREMNARKEAENVLRPHSRRKKSRSRV